MPNIVIQNLTTEDVHLGDFYTKVPKPEDRGPCYANEPGIVESFKSSVELMQSRALHKAIAEGKVTLGITFTPDEIASQFDIFPGISSGGGGTDLTIYDEGVPLTTTADSIDFVGPNVVATNIGNAVTVTLTGGSDNDRVYNETPTGLIDGANTLFTTSAYYDPATEAFFFNGLRGVEGINYTRSESGGLGTGFDTIDLAFPPISGDCVLVDYNGGSVFNETPSGVIDGVNLTYTTASTFFAGTERFYFNGVRQVFGLNYSLVESGGVGTGYNTIVMTNAPVVGDCLLVDYEPE